MTTWIPRRCSHMLAVSLVGLMLCMSAYANTTSTVQESPAATPGLRQIREVKQFEVGIPSDWSWYTPAFGLSPEEKGVFDLVMLGPPSAEGIRSEIKVSYYAPDNLICKTSEKYLRLHAQPVFGTPSPGETYGEVKEERIGGRTVWRFERDSVEYLPPRTLNPKKIPVHQRYVVISAKDGFFVLRSYAGLERKPMVLEQFEAVLGSFKPLVD